MHLFSTKKKSKKQLASHVITWRHLARSFAPGRDVDILFPKWRIDLTFKHSCSTSHCPGIMENNCERLKLLNNHCKYTWLEMINVYLQWNINIWL